MSVVGEDPKSISHEGTLNKREPLAGVQRTAVASAMAAQLLAAAEMN